MNVLIAGGFCYCQIYGTFVLYDCFNDKSYIFLCKHSQKMETINKALYVMTVVPFFASLIITLGGFLI